MTQNNRPMLSVICPTYNHEHYIRQALDGILMQKVNFSMEIIVGEDCSKDGTRQILREYEEKYPGVFTMLYRETNMGMNGNCTDLYERGTGKYIAYLECDDFWIDPNKLQKQVDYLEAHPDVVVCYHNVVVVGHDGKPNGEVYPESPTEDYTLRQYRSECMPGQTSTLMMRNCYVDKQYKFTNICKDLALTPGDRVQVFSFVAYAKVHCIKEPLGAYRHVISQGSSYSATVRRNFYQESVFMADFYRKMMEYARKDNAPAPARKTLEQMYLWRLTAAVVRGRKEADRPSWTKAVKNLEFKTAAVGYCAGRLICLPLKKIYHKIAGKSLER